MKRWLLCLVLAGCGATGGPSAHPGPVLESGSLDRLVVALSDFRSGLVLGLSLVGGAPEEPVPIHGDAIVRVTADGTRYVVNRLGADNLQILSSRGGLLRQIPVGRGTNPQDVVVVSPTAAYVSRFRSRLLYKLDPSTEVPLGPGIDLSRYADADGYPEMTWMARDGERLLILLQRLDTQNGFVPTERSLVAVVNLADDSLAEPVALARTNPVTQLSRGPDGAWYVGCAGRMGMQAERDGAVVSLDGRIVVEEAELGGDIVDFAYYGEERAVAIVSAPDTRLVPFNPKTGKAGFPWIYSSGYHLQQVLWDAERGHLLVADRDPAGPSIRILDGDDGSEKGRYPLDRLPPYHMELSP